MDMNDFSILKTNERNKFVAAILIALAGLIILLFSIYVKTVYTFTLEVQLILFSLLERIGEILIVTGLFIFIIEHNTINKLITKDISVSIIKDLFRFYFKKNQMIDLIVQLTQDLNKSENIPNDVIDLYKRHGILELFNEPIREELHISYSFVSNLDDCPGFFEVKKHWSYRVVNTAKKDAPENLSKKINRTGLIHEFSRPIIGNFPLNGTDDEIQNYLKNTMEMEFYYSYPSVSGSTRIKYKNPIFINYDEFNYQDGIPLQPRESPEDKFYVVFRIFNDEAKIDNIQIGFFFNKLIQPQESLGIDLFYKSFAEDFDLLILDFPSYTQGFCFELELGEQFMTDIKEQIIGKGFISNLSAKNLSYSGWIMPHSSFACVWAKKVCLSMASS